MTQLQGDIQDVISTLFSCVMFAFFILTLAVVFIRFARQAKEAARGEGEESIRKERAAAPREDVREFLEALRQVTGIPVPDRGAAARPAERPPPLRQAPRAQAIVTPVGEKPLRPPPRAAPERAPVPARPTIRPTLRSMVAPAEEAVSEPAGPEAHPPPAATRLEECLPRDLLKRAVLLREILGPCRALRPFRVGWW